MSSPIRLAPRWWLAGILSAICVSRIPWIRYPFFNQDEAIVATIARVITDGGMPYRDAFNHRGPVTEYLIALIFRLFGRNNMEATHWLLLAMVLTTAFLLYRLGTVIRGRWTGVWAAALFTLFSMTGDPLGAQALHTEWTVILLTTLGAYLLLSGLPDLSGWRLAGSGLAFGLAAMAKQPAWFDAVATGCFVLLSGMYAERSMPRRLQAAAWWAGGCLTGVGAIVGIFWATGALPDFWFYYWTYNTRYYLSAMSPWTRLAVGVPLVQGYFQFQTLLLVLFLIGGAALLISAPGRRSCAVAWYPLAWGIAGYIGANWSGRGFMHYYLQLLPAFSLLGGYAVDLLKDALSPARSGGARGPGSALRVAALATLAVGMYMPVVTHARNISVMIRARLGLTRFDFLMPLSAFTDVSRFIRERSREEDHILVWGQAAEIYVLSDRPPATRYMSSNVLTGFLPSNDPRPDTSASIIPGSWDIFMEDLRQTPPLYIIDTSPGNIYHYHRYPMQRFPRLWELVTQRYVREAVFESPGGLRTFDVYRRRS